MSYTFLLCIFIVCPVSKFSLTGIYQWQLRQLTLVVQTCLRPVFSVVSRPRPISHRTRKLASCGNTHPLTAVCSIICIRIVRCSASCVNGAHSDGSKNISLWLMNSALKLLSWTNRDFFFFLQLGGTTRLDGDDKLFVPCVCKPKICPSFRVSAVMQRLFVHYICACNFQNLIRTCFKGRARIRRGGGGSGVRGLGVSRVRDVTGPGSWGWTSRLMWGGPGAVPNTEGLKPEWVQNDSENQNSLHRAVLCRHWRRQFWYYEFFPHVAGRMCCHLRLWRSGGRCTLKARRSIKYPDDCLWCAKGSLWINLGEVLKTAAIFMR